MSGSVKEGFNAGKFQGTKRNCRTKRRWAQEEAAQSSFRETTGSNSA